MDTYTITPSLAVQLLAAARHEDHYEAVQGCAAAMCILIHHAGQPGLLALGKLFAHEISDAVGIENARRNDNGTGFAALAFELDGQIIASSEVTERYPAAHGIVLASQFTTAYANGDEETMQALVAADDTEGMKLCQGFVEILRNCPHNSSVR